MVTIPKQSNFETDINFKLDIEQIYNDLIKEIDNTRSVINITNPNNQQILNSITKKTLTGLRQRLKVEQSAQESRCHAFFRLIGFPVVGKNNFYNPGFNNVREWWEGNNHKVTTINSEFKLEIMKSLLPGFRKLSQFREMELSDISKIFVANESIDACTMALSSSTITRPFAAASENVTTLYYGGSENDLDVSKQSYDVDLEHQGLIGETPGITSLYNYVDGGGNTPTKIRHKRYHVIFPFIVDPWIDYSVCPNSSLIAVPFVKSKDNLKISENAYLKRPFIEKVIRDRFSVETTDTADKDGSYVQSLKEFISLIPSIKDEQLISYVTETATGEEQVQFRKYLNIILEMVSQLHMAQQVIRETQLKYYWLPIPSIQGPEGGVSVRPIMSQFSQAIAFAQYITPEDKNLIKAIIEESIGSANSTPSTTVSALEKPDVGNFALNYSEGSDIANSITSPSESNNNPNNSNSFNTKMISDLTEKRAKMMKDAGIALKKIEIIMGEHSGLGLCDIVAIMGALYIMPKESILGFLDDDAFSRAKGMLNLSITSKPDILTTLNEYSDKVKDFYNLMDKLYSDVVTRNTHS